MTLYLEQSLLLLMKLRASVNDNYNSPLATGVIPHGT